MLYDRESCRIEEVKDLDELAMVLPPAYAFPALVRTRLLRLYPVEIVEIHDFYSKTFLGIWEEDRFDFAGATDAVIATLDAHFRLHFSLRRKYP